VSYGRLAKIIVLLVLVIVNMVLMMVSEMLLRRVGKMIATGGLLVLALVVKLVPLIKLLLRVPGDMLLLVFAGGQIVDRMDCWLVVVVMVIYKVGGGLGVTIPSRPCVGQQVVICSAAHGENVEQEQ
jgi:hypothetical protein